MSTDDCRFHSLMRTFDWFYKTLDAATVPTTDGGRKVGGIAHAVALSEATNALYSKLAAAHLLLLERHGKSLPEAPPEITLMESDSPHGPWIAVPPDAI